MRTRRARALREASTAPRAARSTLLVKPKLTLRPSVTQACFGELPKCSNNQGIYHDQGSAYFLNSNNVVATTDCWISMCGYDGAGCDIHDLHVSANFITDVEAASLRDVCCCHGQNINGHSSGSAGTQLAPVVAAANVVVNGSRWPAAALQVIRDDEVVEVGHVRPRVELARRCDLAPTAQVGEEGRVRRVREGRREVGFDVAETHGHVFARHGPRRRRPRVVVRQSGEREHRVVCGRGRVDVGSACVGPEDARRARAAACGTFADVERDGVDGSQHRRRRRALLVDDGLVSRPRAVVAVVVLRDTHEAGGRVAPQQLAHAEDEVLHERSVHPAKLLAAEPAMVQEGA